MKSSDNTLTMSQRFIKIVDRILVDQKDKREDLQTYSDVSRLLSSGKDRGLLSRIANGQAKPSQNHIRKLAECFNVDFNAFFRDVETVYFNSTYYNMEEASSRLQNEGADGVIDVAKEESERDWLEDSIEKFEEFFRNAEHHISQIPQEYRDGCSSWLREIESQVYKTQQRIAMELLLNVERVKIMQTRQLFKMSAKLNDLESQSLKHLEGYKVLKDKERQRSTGGSAVS